MLSKLVWNDCGRLRLHTRDKFIARCVLLVSWNHRINVKYITADILKFHEFQSQTKYRIYIGVYDNSAVTARAISFDALI